MGTAREASRHQDAAAGPAMACHSTTAATGRTHFHTRKASDPDSLILLKGSWICRAEQGHASDIGYTPFTLS